MPARRKVAPVTKSVAVDYQVTRFEYFACHAFKALVAKHAHALVGNGATELDRRDIRQQIAHETLATTAVVLQALEARDALIRKGGR